MDTRFDHNKLESEIYKMWEESGYLNPDNLPERHKTPYSIVLPPPNVTGTLHMGHAAMLAIQDILIRYHRMKGFKTLWLPGTDHAAIATQEKVEKDIYKKEGKSRHDLGREEFLRRVKDFAAESHDTIVNQVRRMGSSIDWSREAYTLDEARNLAVRTAFKKMYDAGLIYQGGRIVNWDPKLQTTVSDDEVEWIEEKSPFYYLQYGPFIIGTARPETKFGDKYVVMHPKDKRYKQYKHGEKIEVEWINGKITATIVKDEAIDMKFGTGVMTITPWHDATDFEIAERHNLEKQQIIDLRGKLLPVAGEFEGISISKARPLLVEKLTEKGLLIKKDETYTHRVATNSRGGGKIEPQILKQWFVSVNSEFQITNSRLKGIAYGRQITLKEMMIQAVKSGQIKILPKRFEKIYYNWINNLRDWCISRQIIFGHQIPVYYCIKQNQKSEVNSQTDNSKSRSEQTECTEPIVSVESVTRCPHCGGGVEQDPDTLDTWFSSGLWTFSTLGWPHETEDLKTYHPTDVLETAYDIIFFWVARMILMSGFLLGDIPFKTVYFHGLVRDGQGRKMSKSLGNIINPLDLIEKYGADATRLSLIIGSAPGNDMKLSEDRVRGYRNFTTKIWNAARFVIIQEESVSKGAQSTGRRASIKPAVIDRKNLKKFESVKKDVTRYIEKFDLNHAAETLYHYFWHEFADRIIEEAKPRLQNGSEEDKAAAMHTLMTILSESIKMLHPFVPYVTEELWKKIPKEYRRADMLMMEEW